MVIGCAALAFSASFPILATAPPYNWDIVSPRLLQSLSEEFILMRFPFYQKNTGLVTVASFIGYLLAAAPFHALPDRYTAYLARKNGNIRESEFGLWSLVIAAPFAPAGLILYGFAAEQHLHWMALLVAVAMFMFGRLDTSGNFYSGTTKG